MCQIISGPSNKLKSVLLNTEGLLEALFMRNGDGWGAMYHGAKGNRAIKKLPKTVEDTRCYIKDLPSDDRLVAVHWRMRTSGKIDTHNAHPHQVDGGWLIHNGVLDIDTDSAPHLCDTIHFARTFLDGIVTTVVGSTKLQALIGDYIGNNRFVLMDTQGQMCVVNRDQGYEAQGLWFANDYSMPRELVDPSYKVPVRYSYPAHGVHAATKGGYASPKDYSAFSGSADYKWPYGGDAYMDPNDEDDFDQIPSDQLALINAVNDCDVDFLTESLYNYPAETLAVLFDTYVIEPYENTRAEDLSAKSLQLQRALVDADKSRLLHLMALDQVGDVAEEIAQVLCWYCVADYRSLLTN